MPKVIITIGLPGSGKSTWVRKHVELNPNTVVICRDDIRQMMAGGRYVFAPNREAVVFNSSRMMLCEAIEDDFDVIMDETMILRRHRQDVKDHLRGYHDITFSGVYFNAKPNLCKARRADDDKGAGPGTDWNSVIDRMASNFEPPTQDEFDEYTVVTP